MPNEPANGVLSGFNDTKDRCPPHRWVMESTKHAHIAGEGMSNIGQTDGTCKWCGVTHTFESPTPDNVHGIESHILAELAATLDIEEGSGYGGDD